jgi:hypothetical protein
MLRSICCSRVESIKMLRAPLGDIHEICAQNWRARRQNRAKTVKHGDALERTLKS